MVKQYQKNSEGWPLYYYFNFNLCLPEYNFINELSRCVKATFNPFPRPNESLRGYDMNSIECEDGWIIKLQVNLEKVENPIPYEFGALNHLRELQLCSFHHDFNEIPSFIKNLISLEKIFISNYSGTILPDFIGFLPNLKELELIACHELTVLPPSILNLIQLTSLKIDYCECLTLLPDEIGKLTALKILHVHTLLKTIPLSIGNLRNLVDISLFSNFYDIGPINTLEDAKVIAYKIYKWTPDIVIAKLSANEDLDAIDKSHPNFPKHIPYILDKLATITTPRANYFKSWAWETFKIHLSSNSSLIK